MLNIAKILLPVDFSEGSSGAARYAGMIACRFRSELILLHAMPYADYPLAGMEMAGNYADTWPERLDEARDRLDSFLTDELRSLPVRRVVLEGDPAIKIVELAHSEDVNLIVMPTHGYGPFRRFILGSVTAKVLHDADCPVFTGAHLEERPQPTGSLFRNILCAIDLGPQSRKALEWAAGMAAEVNARLHVVHALPELDAGQARYFDQGWRSALHRAAREQVEEFLVKADTPVDVILDNGGVAQVVRDAAGAVKADLVVIGRHADSGILGRLRAHAYAITRESPCPVISV